MWNVLAIDGLHGDEPELYAEQQAAIDAAWDEDEAYDNWREEQE
jgi:hypothetical protein